MADEIVIKKTAEGERLERLVKELTATKLRVGFKPGEHKENDGTDVATVALRNEFGDDKVPARPFMAQAVDKNPKEIDALITKAFQKELPQAVYSIIGEGIAALIRKEIDSGDFVPNSPVTIARKGSDKPLIDTGTMRDSVTYWTEKRG